MSRSPKEVLADEIYSNFDHKFDRAIVDAVLARPGEVYATHPAWDHHGRVWFADGKWHEEVWVYGSPRSVETNESLEELIREVNDRYGYD
jgi:hypothetical protein